MRDDWVDVLLLPKRKAESESLKLVFSRIVCVPDGGSFHGMSQAFKAVLEPMQSHGNPRPVPFD